MPRYLITYTETYTRAPSFEVEAPDAETAIDIADQLVADEMLADGLLEHLTFEGYEHESTKVIE